MIDAPQKTFVMTSVLIHGCRSADFLGSKWNYQNKEHEND